MHPENWPPLLPRMPVLPPKRDMHPARRRRVRVRRDKLALLKRHHPASMSGPRRINAYGDLLIAAFRQTGVHKERGAGQAMLGIKAAQELVGESERAADLSSLPTTVDVDALNALGRVLDQFEMYSEPSQSHYTLAITAFGKARLIPEAEKAWRHLKKAFMKPETVAYNAMLSAYHRAGRPDDVRCVASPPPPSPLPTSLHPHSHLCVTPGACSMRWRRTARVGMPAATRSCWTVWRRRVIWRAQRRCLQRWVTWASTRRHRHTRASWPRT